MPLFPPSIKEIKKGERVRHSPFDCLRHSQALRIGWVICLRSIVGRLSLFVSSIDVGFLFFRGGVYFSFCSVGISFNFLLSASMALS